MDRESSQRPHGIADFGAPRVWLCLFARPGGRSARCSEGAQWLWGAGVLEVVEDDVGGTYRAVYTVKFKEAVFVLHCFQKKSERGIATPKEDRDIIHARLKVDQAFAKELRDEKKDH